MRATIRYQPYRLFVIASNISHLILDCLNSFLPLKQLFLLLYGPVKISSGQKFDYSWQLHGRTFKGLGIRDQIETSPYIQDILTSA